MNKSIQLTFLLFFLSGCTKHLQIEELNREKLAEYQYCAVEVALQESKYSCGAAVLSSTLDYWGIELSEQKIMEKYPPISKKGYSLGQLKSILEDYSFDAYLVEGSSELIKQEIDQGRPIIVPLLIPKLPLFHSIYTKDILLAQKLIRKITPKYNHFLLIMGYSETNYLVGDSSKGIKEISQNELLNLWKPLEKPALVFARTAYSSL